jgi:hypothetical protein
MKLRVRAVCAIAILLTVSGVVRQTVTGQTQRPNILLIVSDDLGYADLGVYGSKIFQHQTSIGLPERGSASRMPT